MLIDFNWFADDRLKNVINMVLKILDIIRIIVPIVLIVMTSLDIAKKVINPEEKEGQKKIMIRAIAALLVFLAPTLVNIFLKIANINVPNLDGGGGGSNTHNTPQATMKPTPTFSPVVTYSPTPTINPTPTVIPTNTPKPTLSSLNIINCPGLDKKFSPGDKIKLNTDILSSFNGNIEWSVNKNNVKIIPSSDKKSSTIEFLDSSKDEVVTVTVKAGDKLNSCIMYANRTRQLSSFSFTNCPSVSKIHNTGDKFMLTTDIPTSYKGEINWSKNKNIIKITPSSDKRNANVEILDSPTNEVVDITVNADGIYKICSIYVQAKKEVSGISITNCPTNQVFKNGNTVRLNTNIPTSYKGEVIWGWGISNGNINVITETNQEYAFSISNVTQRTSFNVLATLDSNGESDSCKITIEP